MVSPACAVRIARASSSPLLTGTSRPAGGGSGGALAESVNSAPISGFSADGMVFPHDCRQRSIRYPLRIQAQDAKEKLGSSFFRNDNVTRARVVFARFA